MDVLATLSLAVGLAADAFAVSVSSGLAIRRVTLHKALKIALFLGGFQMGMPLLGWLLSAIWRSHLMAFDHWIAWGLLTALGIKAMHAACSNTESDELTGNPLDTVVLTALAIATSLDALAAGVGLAALPGSAVAIAATIGAVTFGLCLVGPFLGRHCAHLLAHRVEFLGGALLITLGSKILYEHLHLEGGLGWGG